jgi:hypothetical protein
MWDMWWTKWHWGRFLEYFTFPLPISFHQSCILIYHPGLVLYATIIWTLARWRSGVREEMSVKGGRDANRPTYCVRHQFRTYSPLRCLSPIGSLAQSMGVGFILSYWWTNGTELQSSTYRLFPIYTGFPAGGLFCCPPACLQVFAELISSTLNMEAICSSETSVKTQWTTRRHISEDDTLHIRHYKVSTECFDSGSSCWSILPPPFNSSDFSISQNPQDESGALYNRIIWGGSTMGLGPTPPRNKYQHTMLKPTLDRQFSFQRVQQHISYQFKARKTPQKKKRRIIGIFSKDVKGSGRGLMRYYPSIYPEWLRNITRNLSQVGRCTDRESNPASPERKSEKIRFSVRSIVWVDNTIHVV